MDAIRKNRLPGLPVRLVSVSALVATLSGAAWSQPAPGAQEVQPSAQGAEGPRPAAPPQLRMVTGTDPVQCADNETLVSVVCARGASDGTKCAIPGTSATALCLRK